MMNFAGCLSSARTVLAGLIGCALAAGAAQAYTEKVLNGAVGYPYSPLLRVGDTFYGASLLGGNLSCNPPNGCGTVFQMDRRGHTTVLYSFAGVGKADGAFPGGPVIRDAQGNLYGTTEGGGIDCDASGTGCGTVFKIDSTGKETVLHAFTDSYGGLGPNSGVASDASGNLYGTNYSGGADNAGSIFEIDAAGNYTLLHSFTGAKNDGSHPNLTPLMLDKKGNLYGVTAFGGSAGGWGVVYRYDTTRSKLKVLYSFSGGADGGYPMGALLRDAAGNFYGTTNEGGIAYGNGGNGVAYKLSKDGVQTVLYTMPADGLGADGPYGAGLVKDKAGNLFGTTRFLGANHRGNVFEIDSSGNETDLYSFTGGTDGGSPEAPVILDPKGNIYGTTTFGGESGSGVAFRLTP